MKIVSAILMLFVAVPAMAIECGVPPEAIQKAEVAKAVANTEKLPVSKVEITAPGLALVSYGKGSDIAQITFTFHCSASDNSDAIYKNPTGFHVLSYTKRNK